MFNKKSLYISIIAMILVVIAGSAFGQNPQTQTAPIYSVNAKYVNGTAPGYAPTAGTGLVLNLGAGTANCSGTIATYAGGTFSLTASATNYIYLNTSASCAPAVKTSVFTVSDIPLAVVVTGLSTISSITDVRTMFSPSGGSTGSVSGQIVNTLPLACALNTICASSGITQTGSGTSTVDTFPGFIAANTTCPSGAPTGSVCVNGTAYTSVTVATLPAASSVNKNVTMMVSDGTSSSDCTTGGSTFQALCTSNGAAWVAQLTTDAVGDLNIPKSLSAQNSYFLSSNLLHWNACLNLARNGGVCEIAYSGDSWPGFYLAEPLSDQLRGILGDGGIGYVSFNYSASTHPVDISVFSPSGTWTLCAQTTICVGIDASDQTSSGTAGWTIAAPFSYYVWHYYQQSGGGTLTWTVDGGSSCGALGSATCSGTVNTAGTASPQIATFGPYTYGVHTVVLSATNNTRMMGQKLISGNPGIIVDNVGSAGIKALGYTQLNAATWEADWVNLLGTAQPTLVIDTLGTNDQTAAVVPATFGTQMSTIISEIQAAVPLADVLLSTNTSQDLSSTYPTSQYVTAQLGLVSSTVGVLNNYALFPGYTAAVNIGLMWPNGNVHPAGPGEAQIVGNISGYLLGNRVKTLGDGSLGDTYYRAGINGNQRIYSCSLRGPNLFTGTWAYLGPGFSYSSPTLTASSAANNASTQTYMTLIPGDTYMLTFNATMSAGGFQPQINATGSPTVVLGQVVYAGESTTSFSIPFTVPYNWGTVGTLLAFSSEYGVGPTNPLTGTISNISVTQCLGGDSLVNGNEEVKGNRLVDGNDHVEGNLQVDGNITTSGTGLPTAVSTVDDIICAAHADPTAGKQTVSSVSSTSSTLTYTLSASVPGFMEPGMPIQCQGNTTGGYNGGPTSGSGTWTINAATTGNSLVLNSTANPGAGTGGGTCSLVCSNQSLDGATNFLTFATQYTVPANSIGTTVTSLKARPQFGVFSSPGAAPLSTMAWYLSTSYNVWRNTSAAIGPGNNAINVPGTYPVDLTFPTAYPATVFATQPPFAMGGTTTITDVPNLTGASLPPLLVNTTFGLPLQLVIKYTAHGIGIPTYSSGGTPTGTGTCLLAASGGGGTGGQLVMNVSSGTVTGFSLGLVGGIVLGNTGYSYTSEPTSWTYVSGSACSTTVTTTGGALGGSWGDFLIFWGLQVSQ